MIEPWTDEQWTAPESPIDEHAAFNKINHRESQIDKGLSEWRRLQDELDVWLAESRAFDHTVARREIQIILAGCYPDPDAPKWVHAAAEDGHGKMKASRTDASKLARLEVLTDRDDGDPWDVVEALKRRIEMVKHHVGGRGNQLNGAQSQARMASQAIHEGGRFR